MNCTPIPVRTELANQNGFVSSTSNETLSGGSNITQALKEYFPSLTQSDIQQFLAVYPESDFDNATQRFEVATGEPDVRRGRSIIGLAAAQKSKAFTYRYNQRPSTQPASDPEVHHSAENWMMFLGTNTGYIVSLLTRALRNVYTHLSVITDSTVQRPLRR